ncbi:MAG: GNA1162 family protein [Campylobacterota bacterium]
MYDQQPRSILILPPMNESTDAEAKDYYMTTTEMVSDIMKQEGVYDTEILYNMPLDKYRDYFGADAILFTTIKKWDVSYMVLASSLTISIEARIVSTSTSEELWKYTGTVVVDLSGGDTGEGIGGLIAKAVIAAVNTATADYVKHAHTANKRIIHTLPFGPYHEAHLKDQSVQLISQTPVQK